MKRILTALALIPTVTYVVLWADYWVFLFVLMAVALLCYHEYDTIAGGFGFGNLSPMGYGAGLVLLVWQGESWPLVTVIALAALAAAMRADNLSKTLPRAALLLFGVMYVFGCWKFAMPLRDANHHWLMYALLLNWAGDTGAYYVGRAFGKHRMAPRVSPKKSWEGAAASVATAILVGGAYIYRFIPGMTIPVAIGQGDLRVTPIQLARAIGGLSMGGVWFRPHLVKGPITAKDKTTWPLDPVHVQDVVDGMYGVVNEGGTGARAALPGIELCGKTGSAQLASIEVAKASHGNTLKDNAWFVGFAPRRAPEIVVVALFEHGEHGQFAATIVRDVVKAYFDKKTRIQTWTQQQSTAAAGLAAVSTLGLPVGGTQN